MTVEDHRIGYTPLQLYSNGCRMVDDYDVDQAVETYVRLHPESDAAKVRAELESEIARVERASLIRS